MDPAVPLVVDNGTGVSVLLDKLDVNSQRSGHIAVR